MKTPIAKTLMLLMLCLALAVAATSATAEEERRDRLYICDCGDACKCNTVKTEPGKCECGMELKGTHILKVDGSKATVCTCGPECKCTGFDPDDPTKCACGKPVREVELKGTGIYFCNCGGSCTCNTAMDEPGECRCGMKLKKMD